MRLSLASPSLSLSLFSLSYLKSVRQHILKMCSLSLPLSLPPPLSLLLFSLPHPFSPLSSLSLRYFIRHLDLRDRAGESRTLDQYEAVVADLRARVGDNDADYTESW